MGAILERLQGSFPARFYAKWSEDRAGDGAILIAWQALLSLFPLILGLLSILGYVLRSDGMRESLVGAIVSQFPSQVGDLLGFLEETRELGGILGLVSLVGLLWSGSNLFGVMASVFDRFYGAPDRSLVAQRLLGFAMVFVYAALISVSVVASGISTFLVGVSEQVLPFQIPGSALVAGWVVSFASAALMFFALYRIVPNVPLGFRDVWRGTLLAAVLVVALSQAFPIYLGFMGGGFAVYKTLGVFFLMMTWFYFLANVTVLGAELNAFCSGHKTADSTPEASPGRENGQARARADATSAVQGGATGGGRGQGRAAPRPRAAPTMSPAGGNNGRRVSSSPWKAVVVAGLAATLTGVALAAAQKTAAGVWRAITHASPSG